LVSSHLSSNIGDHRSKSVELTGVTREPSQSVKIGGEMDNGSSAGFVLLAVEKIQVDVCTELIHRTLLVSTSEGLSNTIDPPTDRRHPVWREVEAN
jgi:hypothetical protein